MSEIDLAWAEIGEGGVVHFEGPGGGETGLGEVVWTGYGMLVRPLSCAGGGGWLDGVASEGR